MFGIDDPFIILPYLLSVVCVIFAAWFGLKYWNCLLYTSDAADE